MQSPLIGRRGFLGLAVASAVSATAHAAGPFKPFRLRVVRTGNLGTTLSLNSCLTGVMFWTETFDVSSYGHEICDTLELPYRANLGEISAIPVGVYAGKIREDGKLGWRVELSNVPGPRHNIQIHPGNITSQIQGCILVGETADGPKCYVADSRKTRDQIKSLYGGNDARPIEVKIQDG